MTQMLVCTGAIEAPIAPETMPTCSTGWAVSAFDQSELLAQLAQLNTFDAEQAAQHIAFCMLIFTVGFIAGVIIRNLRRV